VGAVPEKTLTENSAINSAMPPKKPFVLLFMLCPFFVKIVE
jgi:hypothetical protein